MTNEEVMDKLEIFQARFVKKLTNLAGGIWKEFQQMQVCSLPPWSSMANVKSAVFNLNYQLYSISNLTKKLK